MIELRYYQTEAEQALFDYWGTGGGNGLIELATGTGKSLLGASLTRRLVTDYRDMRIGIMTHVKELIEQNAQEMLRFWPQAPIGIHSAGVGRYDMRSQVLFGGIQSCYRKARQFGAFDLLLIDECHLIPRKSDTMYGRFINDCRDMYPEMRLAGLTATPYRLDSGRLDEGDDAVFDKIVYSYDIARGIADGYLAPLISKRGAGEINVEGVRIRGGEFDEKSLQERAREPSVIEEAAREITAYMREQARNCALAFCTGIDHANAVRDALRRFGVRAETITGDMHASERARIINALKTGQIECICNVGIMTTGTNIPGLNLIAMLRPTLSTVLYIQILGRGTRIVCNVSRLLTAELRRAAIAASDKPDCLVLDYAGNGRRHGPVDDIRAPEGKAAKPDIPAEENNNGDIESRTPIKVRPETVQGKDCPDCNALVRLDLMTCPHCDYQWPVNADHSGRADGETGITKAENMRPPEWLQVNGWNWYFHEKPGKPRSLRIEYDVCGEIWPYREWVCFEHDGYARQKAVQTWAKLEGSDPAPETVSEAVSRMEECRIPEEILVRKTDKFPEIVSRRLPVVQSQMNIDFAKELGDEIPF